MKSIAAFKKALQTLTTTVVKAEAAQASNAAAFEALRVASVAQRQQLCEAHAALVAELGESETEAGAAAAFPHGTWFGQTVARAEALFGPIPA